MHMIQVTFHLFRDNFSLLSILSSHLFPYPHACLLLTHALSIVNMQYLPRMTFISFPIAHSPHPVNHPSYVFPITLLILQNDTPDIASPPTYYATRITLRLPETFALLPHLPPSTFGTKVPCLPIQPMHPVLMCSTSYPVLRWRDARVRRSQAHVDSPSAPRLSAIPYSSVSRETCEDHPRAQLRERELDMRPGCRPPRCARRPSPCSLRSPCAPVRTGTSFCRLLARARMIPRRHSLLIGFT